LERKIRLLEEMQDKRKKEGERFLDKSEASLRRNPSDAPHGGGQASNRKKILNSGNEPKAVLKTSELGVTAPSKRTPFCPGKSAIKAKKRGVSMQEAARTGDSRAAGLGCILERTRRSKVRKPARAGIQTPARIRTAPPGGEQAQDRLVGELSRAFLILLGLSVLAPLVARANENMLKLPQDVQGWKSVEARTES
jgi:hypothetical protein